MLIHGDKSKAIKQQEEYYLNNKDAFSRLRKEGIPFRFTGPAHSNGDQGCFFSSAVNVQGLDHKSINMGFSHGYGGSNTEELPGVFCPDCGAQGYKTDHKDIATCGAYAGWFFFYRSNSDLNEVKDEKKEEIAYEIKIINGQYVKVPKLNFNNKSPIINKEVK